MPPQRIFALERVVDQLYDTVYPPNSPKERKSGFERGIKLFIAETMACLVPAESARKLIEPRSYYRIDLEDFMEYATTELASSPTLGNFPEGEAAFYEFIRTGEMTCLEGEIASHKVQIHPIDAVITRSYPFVSITARFSCPPASETPAPRLSASDQIPYEHLVTILFAAHPEQERTLPDDNTGFEEWDRYAFCTPCEGDNDWRFMNIAGIYTDSLIANTLEDESSPDWIRKWAQRIKQTKHDTEPAIEVQYELARLMLTLPKYVAFMYDLVTEERRQLPKPPQLSHRFVKRRLFRQGPTYRIIKSIRVIRPETVAPSVPWRAPARLHAVRGHWRTLSSEESQGKSEDGSRIAGKTWVRDHTRGQIREVTTDVELQESHVVINIKQTLRYARDVIQAVGATVGTHVQVAEELNPGKPSGEWMANERAKLSAGLRFLILKRDGYRCRQCGASAADDNYIKLEVDHRVPVSAWGRTEEENLWTLCVPCNRGKSDRR